MSHRALGMQFVQYDPTPASDTHGVPEGRIASDIREWNGHPVHDPVSAAWESVGAPEPSVKPEDRHPDRYFTPERGLGVRLRAGHTERHYGTLPDGTASQYDVTPVPWAEREKHEIVTGGSGMPQTQPDGSTTALAKVPGSERPIRHVFRIVHEAEFQQAAKRGFLQTHGGMNLGKDEGTCASEDSTGSFYAAAGPNRILRIDHRPEDGWKRDNDGYIKTQQPVPFDRISRVSPILHNEETDTRHQPGGGSRRRRWTLPQGFT